MRNYQAKTKPKTKTKTKTKPKPKPKMYSLSDLVFRGYIDPPDSAPDPGLQGGHVDPDGRVPRPPLLPLLPVLHVLEQGLEMWPRGLNVGALPRLAGAWGAAAIWLEVLGGWKVYGSSKRRG